MIRIWNYLKSLHLCGAIIFCYVISTAMIVQAGDTASPSDKEAPIPEVILSGLRDHAFKGAEVAIKTWVKGSALEGSLEATGYLDYLRQIESRYGKYIDFQQIRSHHLTSNVRLFYFILNYERGPIFARFMTFRDRQAVVAGAWIIPQIVFQTSPDFLLPPPGYYSIDEKR